MSFLGDVMAILILLILERAGVFELAPPSVLSKKGDFPNCAEIAAQISVDDVHAESCSRYIDLCRITGVAWAMWTWIVVLSLTLIAFFSYHLYVVHDSEKIFVEMKEIPHVPITLSLWGGDVSINCWMLFCAAFLFTIVTVVAYSCFLPFCRDAASNLCQKGKTKRKNQGVRATARAAANGS